MKLSLATAGCALAAVLVWGFVLHERQLGALRFQLAAADSAHVADSAFAAHAVQTALRATQTADSFRAIYRADQAKDRAVRAATDSAVRHLASARDSALAVARDSAATVGQLRESLTRLVAVSDSSEAAHKVERTVTLRELALAQRTIIADSLAQAHSTDAINAMTKRAVDAETQNQLLKRLAPSTVGGWLKVGAGVGLGVLAGKLLR